MVLRSSPETPTVATRRGHIDKPILRLAICTAAVFAVVAALSVIHVQRDRTLSAALNLFLIIVLIASIRWGTRYAIFVSLLSTFGFSWSIEPIGHFHLSDGRVWALLTVCLVTGIVAGQLSSRVRRAVVDADHRRAEAVAAHQRFRDLVNSVEGIVWEADAQSFVFSFVSEQAERILGYPVEQWLHEPTFWRDHLHPEDRDRAMDLCLQATAEKRGHDFEHRMIAADGRVVWLRGLVSVVVEKDRATQLRGVMIDITKRKQAEEAARRSENELRDIIETIPAMAFSIRPDGSTEFVNRRVQEYTGLPADTISGPGWQSTVHPDDLQGHMNKWRASLASGEPFENEVRHRGANGGYRWFLIRAVPLRDEHGTILKWYGLLTDIEGRKRAEQRLHTAMSERARLAAFQEEIRTALAHEGNLREILQNCAEAILRHFDASFARIWTLSGDSRELQLQASAGKYTRLDGSHSRIPIGHLKIGLIAQERKPYLSNDVQNDPRVDKNWARREGMISFAGYPLVVEDRVVGVMGLFAQKTLPEAAPETLAHVADAIAQGIGRKLAEEAVRRSAKQLRDAIDTIPAMAWSTLPDGANDFANQSWFEYTGISSEGAAGTGWKVSFHPDDIATHVEKWRASLAIGKPFESEARIQRAKDGVYRWFLTRGVPLRDENGNILKWYGIATDIDDRKRAEALLAGEKRILEMLARGDSLAQILDSLCRLVEEQASGVLASILLVDGIRLRHGGAPSLPKAYTDAIDGVVIGPAAGSCGTAAYRGEQVIVEDITTDALWADYREAALPHSLRACWSTPVFSSEGKVIATFAMYYRERRTPSPHDQEIIEQITHLAGVAIERKLTQEALQRSEAYLAEAQKLSHAGSWAWSPITRETLYWSEEMFRIYELDPQQGAPAAEAFWERVHPEDRDGVRELMRMAVQQKAEYVHHHRIVLPDGTVKQIHAKGHPRLDAAGELVEFVGTAIDVSERKRVEEALRRNEAYLAEAQRLTHTGSWAYNPATERAIYWSEEMFRIFGLDPRSSSPPDREWFFRLMHPDDRDRFNERVEKAYRNKTDFVQDYRIVLPDGAVRHLHEIGHPVLDEAGNIIEYVGTEVDVTERKRVEEEVRAAETRFRASVDHLTDALFIHDDQDDQGRVIDVNQRACDSLGYTRGELIGMTAFDYDAFVDATFMRSIKERVARGEIFSFESVHRRKDGTTFPVEVRARPFWHGDHRFGLALVRDITDRRRAEAERERLRQREAELSHINRVSMLGELASSLAHELHQPITAAITNANTSLRWLAREEPALDDAREAILRIVKDGTRAAGIINRLRSFYKKGSPPEPELVDLNEVANEMLMLLRNEGNRYSIAMRTELAGELPRIMADRVQLQQVFMNLMLNGIEAMKDTTGELTVKSERTANGQVLISVSDTGVGLPGEKLEQIFNAFFTTKPHGTGMGLAITRSIVEAHGGRLWASANAGRGATFHFTLPTEATAPPTSVG